MVSGVKMETIRQLSSQFFAQLGFDAESVEYQVLVDAADYYVNKNIPSVSDFSALSPDNTVIMAFSFGLGLNNTPGATNTALAAIIKSILDERHFPVLAQWEIADALGLLGITEAFRAIKTTGYLNTEGVLMQFKTELDRRGMNVKTALIVAQPDHFFRCQQLVKKQGFEVILPEYCLRPQQPWSAFGCDEWGYDPTSTQAWTTTKPKFILKEFSALLRIS